MGSKPSTSKSTSTDEGAAAAAAADKKASLYQRFQDRKRGSGTDGISDEDYLKYTGKTRDELREWADGRPGVGGNQLAGKAHGATTSGLSGVAMGDGLGGWGRGAEPGDAATRGMKFPPEAKGGKKVVDEDSD